MSKLTRKDKIEIYERSKNGETVVSLAKSFNVNKIIIHYLIKLIRKHGYDVLGNGKNRLYSKDFKLQTINRIIVNHESINSVAIDVGLASSSILHNWLSKFKENGYNILEKPKGRPSKMKKNNKNIENKELSKVEQLEKELEYLRAENAVLKKLREIRLKQSQTKRKQK